MGGALLRQQGLDWFNPDAYARELVRELRMDIREADARAWEYGRRALEAAIANRTNHAFETTLGGRTISGLLAAAADTHSIVMLYCSLASPELHIARVALRVAHGGHHIADERIRERWSTSRLNLIELLPRLSRLQVFDNSTEVEHGQKIGDPALVLDFQDGDVVPDASDPAVMTSVPNWARPIVEAALKAAGAD